MILANLGVISQDEESLVLFDYLFDLPSIGVGEIGFSTQKLKSTTTEFGLVQRSSDLSIDTLLYSASGKYDLDSMMLNAGVSLGAWANGSDVRVHTWYNQGNGGDLVQATYANQPYIVTDGVLETIGGNSSVYFNGDQYMVNTNTINLTQPNAWNILISFEDKGVQLNQIPFDSGPSGTSRQIPVWLDDFAAEFKYYTGSNQIIRISDFNDNNWFCNYNYPTDQEIYHNNNDSPVTQSGNKDLLGLTIGARYTYSSQFKGHIKEVTAWDVDKSANRQEIYDNVIGRF